MWSTPLLLAISLARVCGLQILPGCHLASVSRSATSLRVTVPRLSDDEDYDELDALDTTESWDEELAQMEAWKASQEKKSAAELPLDDVDEEAWFDEKDDEDPAARTLRQLSEKQAAMMLNAIEAKSPPSGSNKPVLTSLEAVITMLTRIEGKVDALSAKVAKLEGSTTATGSSSVSPPNPASTAASSDENKSAKGEEKAETQWDGEVDESAWFDVEDDDDDMPDWRDVRRLNNLL